MRSDSEVRVSAKVTADPRLCSWLMRHAGWTEARFHSGDEWSHPVPRYARKHVLVRIETVRGRKPIPYTVIQYDTCHAGQDSVPVLTSVGIAGSGLEPGALVIATPFERHIARAGRRVPWSQGVDNELMNTVACAADGPAECRATRSPTEVCHRWSPRWLAPDRRYNMERPPLLTLILKQELTPEDPIMETTMVGDHDARNETILEEDPVPGHDAQGQGGSRDSQIGTDGRWRTRSGCWICIGAVQPWRP